MGIISYKRIEKKIEYIYKLWKLWFEMYYSFEYGKLAFQSNGTQRFQLTILFFRKILEGPQVKELVTIGLIYKSKEPHIWINHYIILFFVGLA
jgi:hypothetical protein